MRLAMGNRRVEVRPESYVARAWRIALAHMRLGEIPIEQSDLASVEMNPSAARLVSPEAHVERSSDEVDRSVEESFPASDPPSWTSSHA
jgi:hypothetical protein